MNADLIGWLATTLTTVAFVPQVWRAWKTRSARDLSLSMYLIFTAGVVLWLTYGLMIQSWPIIVGNIVTLVLASSVLVMKLKFG
jgi:MtN3 and saliva related transmembrane protein